MGSEIGNENGWRDVVGVATVAETETETAWKLCQTNESGDYQHRSHNPNPSVQRTGGKKRRL